MAEYREERLNIPALITITVVSVVLVLVSVVAVQTYVRYEVRRVKWPPQQDL